MARALTRLIAPPGADDERRLELAATAWSCAYHFLLLAAYYVIRPVRDAMALRGSVRALPWLFAGTIAATLVVTPLFAALVERLPRRKFVPLVYHFFAANLVVFFFVLRASPSPTAARVFFVWTSVFNLFAVSVFWGFMADRFGAAAAARRFGVIALGGTLGAIAGAAVTSFLVERIGAAPLMLVSALVLEGAVVCCLGVMRGARASEREPLRERRPPWHVVVTLARSPHLSAIAAYVLFYTVTSTFAYFEQAELAQRAVAGDAARTVLFARIDLAVNIASVVLQATATAALLRRAGVMATLLILPLATLAGFAGLALAPSLALIVVFQIVRRTADYVAARPARELCFVVVDREGKYAVKSLIDTFVYRGGDAIAAAGFGVAGALAPVVVLPLCAAWIAVAVVLGRRHPRRDRFVGNEDAR